MKKVLSVLLVISISLFTMAVSIEANSYNKNYFSRSFDKNGVEVITELEKEELMLIVDDLVAYLKHEGEEELLTPHFNEREVEHMKDVQVLFDLCRTIKCVSFVLSLIILMYFIVVRDFNRLGKTLLFGLIANYIIFGIIALLALVDFNKYFTYFHLIFFDNDLWILNPKTDLMIQMLPESFFIGMATNILLTFFIVILIHQLIGYFLIRRSKSRES